MIETGGIGIPGDAFISEEIEKVALPPRSAIPAVADPFKNLRLEKVFLPIIPPHFSIVFIATRFLIVSNPKYPHIA